MRRWSHFGENGLPPICTVSIHVTHPMPVRIAPWCNSGILFDVYFCLYSDCLFLIWLSRKITCFPGESYSFSFTIYEALRDRSSFPTAAPTHPPHTKFAALNHSDTLTFFSTLSMTEISGPHCLCAWCIPNGLSFIFFGHVGFRLTLVLLFCTNDRRIYI